MKKFIISVIVVGLAIFAGWKFWFESNDPLVHQTLTPTPYGTSIPSASTSPTIKNVLIEGVPFTSQAPYGDWADPRQENGCEESSSLMAVYWARGQSLTKDKALSEILAISDQEQKKYGDYIDTSVDDTVSRIMEGYFDFHGATAKHDITAQDVIDELEQGHLVLIPVNGRQLDNPYYTAPGPLEHMLVLIGYDPKNDEFIANDPGTRRGEHYRYSVDKLINAAYDYGTGHIRPVDVHKNMIVVEK